MACFPPVIARIAGLPVDTVLAFSSSLCNTSLNHLRVLEESLLRARAELSEELYRIIHCAPAEVRRFLLAVKRDSYNGRSLSKHQDHPEWPTLLDRMGDVARTALVLEERLESARTDFESAYADRLGWERNHLLGYTEDQHFLRGVALGSPGLVTELPRLCRTSSVPYGRRERRIEGSLLRYVTRSAMKLSPFSTLTRVAFGRTCSEAMEIQATDPRCWSERSEIRSQRYIFDLLLDLLSRRGPCRDRLAVEVNPTIECVDESVYRLIRPSYWDRASGKAGMEQVKPALVRLRIRGPLIPWLLAHHQSWPSYSDLVTEVVATFPSIELQRVRAIVDQLLGLGFLCFAWPWSSVDLRLEQKLVTYLENLPDREALRDIEDRLRRLVDILENYSTTTTPARMVAEGRELVHELLRRAVEFAGVGQQAAEIESKEWFFHEDVFLCSDNPTLEIFTIPPVGASRALESLDPLVRMANLASNRLEFLLTVQAFAAKRWAGVKEVPFLDFFEAAYPIFEDHVRFDVESRGRTIFHRPVFNPLDLASLEELRRCRERVAEGLETCFVTEGEDCRLDLDRLRRILAQTSGMAAESRDFCAFVQPLDSHGRQWVLNLLVDGFGRLGSRFTAVMPQEIIDQWTAYFIAQSTFLRGEDRIEIVDMYFPGGHTPNVHAPQTRRVLEIPGQSTGLSPQRCLRLTDLWIRLDSAMQHPILVDSEGRVILPHHLGSVASRYLAAPLKFLALFGPGEFRSHLPRQRSYRENGVQVSRRHWAGNVVYGRRTWACSTDDLRADLSGRSAAAAYLRINRWRSERGIPDRVFIAEPLPTTESRSHFTKPQYIDFTSCLLVELFRSIVMHSVEEIQISEVLPSPEEISPAQDGQRWAFEVQLERAPDMPTGEYNLFPNRGEGRVDARNRVAEIGDLK